MDTVQKNFIKNFIGKDVDEILAQAERTIRSSTSAHGVKASPPPITEFMSQEMSPEYVGEENGGGWHTPQRGNDESAEDFEKRKASQPKKVTRYFDEKERESHTVSVNDKGKLITSEGSPFTSYDATTEFAIDATSGDIVVRQGPDGNSEKARTRDDGTEEAVHHSTLAAGGAVALAGDLNAFKGEIQAISNDSGHYKPQFKHLLQVVENFMQNGAMIDKHLTDMDGNNLTENALAVYESTAEVRDMTELKMKQTSNFVNNMKTEGIDTPDRHANNTKVMQSLIDDLEELNALLLKSQKYLGEIGAGPANKMQGDVLFVNASTDVTGQDFREVGEKSKVSRTRTSAQGFLSGVDNGNNTNGLRDATARKAVLDQIKDPDGHKEITEEIEKKYGKDKGISENHPDHTNRNDLDEMANTFLAELKALRERGVIYIVDNANKDTVKPPESSANPQPAPSSGYNSSPNPPQPKKTAPPISNGY